MTDLPFTFANLLGQDKAKDLLQRSWANNKMAHAYLFKGPAGVGKTRGALTMAAYVNCKQPAPTHEVCGQCSSCRKFQAGSHPDLMVIRPDGAMIKINQIRKLKQAITFRPFEAEYRVIVLEDVHTMRREAANSLLKTLEEPPDRNILILTADEAGDLLPTIVSRCQTIPFYGLDYDLVARALTDKTDLTFETAQTLAAVAEGSLDRARLLLDSDLLNFRREIVDRLFTTLARDQPEAVGVALGLAEKAADLKENLPEFFSLLKTWFRDLMLLAAGASQQLIVNRDLIDTMAAASNRWNLEQLFDKLRLIGRAEKALLRNCNRTLVCEVLFLQLI